MTRKDLTCVHEPFGDAFYFGPERLSSRYENDSKARHESGFEESTYKTIFDNIEKEKEAVSSLESYDIDRPLTQIKGKRLFIKDIAHYLSPPHSQDASIAPSLGGIPKRGVGTDDKATNGVNGDSHDTTITTDGATDGHANGTKAPFPYGTEAEPGNPTVVPAETLKKFHFTFLIRHPRSSIPSYYRCTVPPLDKITGFSEFYPSEAGYDELRRIFDYLKDIGQIGPKVAGEGEKKHVRGGTELSDITNSQTNGHANGHATNRTVDDKVSITLIDADDLLDNPNGIIQGYCKEVGLEYSDSMLRWDSEEERQRAKVQFEKWSGFHEDAIESSSLRPRDPAKVSALSFLSRGQTTEANGTDVKKKKPKSKEVENAEWAEKFGEEAARVIRDTVDANVADYEYLKQFAMKVPFKEPQQL